MAGHDAISAVSNAATNPTHYANPTASLHGGQDISLSEMAKSMLSSVSELQSGFQKDVAPASQESAQVRELEASGQTERVDPQHVPEAAKILADQIEQSTQVQQQLTRFMMASSVSSSLGRNLNMFLRGQ